MSALQTVESSKPLPGPERWAHQRREYLRSRDAIFWALFLEQRTGKSPVLIDTAHHLWRAGRITALLYLGPKGVHHDFVADYLPLYLADAIPWRAHVWRSDRARNVGVTNEQKYMLETFHGLTVLSLNIDAILTPTARKFLTEFLRRNRTLVAVDESLDISEPSAARTKMAIRIARRCAYRRILDGTPADAGPFGLYSQCEFLQPAVLGFTSYIAFKRRYAVLEEKCMAQGMRDHVIDPQTGVCEYCHRRRPQFTVVATDPGDRTKKWYRNLGELNAKLARFSSRVLREQCADLPPKVYEKRTFVLGDEARRAYDELRRTFAVEMAEAVSVTAPMILTRYLRLQQISSGFVAADPSFTLCRACSGAGCATCGELGVVGVPPELVRLPGKNARLLAFEAAVAQLRPSDQTVVWCRWTEDIHTLAYWATRCGEPYVLYHGPIDPESRAKNRRNFQEGHARFMFANPRAGGRGNDFSAASTVVYYSHDWPLRWRRQSEDRAQNLNKKSATLYIDLVAADTVDEKIVTAQRNGRELSELVMEERFR